AEQPPVLAPPQRELQLYALVAGEERQIAVRRRRADDLQTPVVLETAEGGHNVTVQRLKQLPQSAQPRLPVVDEGHERRIAGRGQRRRGFPENGLALVGEGLELQCECRARELVRARRRDADRPRRPCAVGRGRALLQRLGQGGVAVE